MHLMQLIIHKDNTAQFPDLIDGVSAQPFLTYCKTKSAGAISKAKYISLLAESCVKTI